MVTASFPRVGLNHPFLQGRTAERMDPGHAHPLWASAGSRWRLAFVGCLRVAGGRSASPSDRCAWCPPATRAGSQPPPKPHGPRPTKTPEPTETPSTTSSHDTTTSTARRRRRTTTEARGPGRRQRTTATTTDAARSQVRAREKLGLSYGRAGGPRADPCDRDRRSGGTTPRRSTRRRSLKRCRQHSPTRNATGTTTPRSFRSTVGLFIRRSGKRIAITIGGFRHLVGVALLVLPGPAGC